MAEPLRLRVEWHELRQYPTVLLRQTMREQLAQEIEPYMTLRGEYDFRSNTYKYVGTLEVMSTTLLNSLFEELSYYRKKYNDEFRRSSNRGVREERRYLHTAEW